MSNLINRLLGVGLHCMTEDYPSKQAKQGMEVEQHCQHLIIQMNALIKNMSAEILKLGPEDFERLQQAAVVKYHELMQV